jgi:3-deoxy-D-manno-octulosonic-acid transferase
MAYSLGLTLYNLAGRHGPHQSVARPARPAGPLVWLHAPGAEALPSMLELARHLIEDDGVQVLLTSRHPPQTPTNALLQSPPSDFPRAAAEFLDHWRPELGIMAQGELLPAMLHECTRRKLPLLMVGARAPVLSPGRDGWYPGLTRTCLQAFSQIMVLDDAAARAFRRAGAEAGQTRVAGRMEEPSAALPHVESDRAFLAALMATRPVWLAADVAPEEMRHVIAAHRAALQLAHRLLLILVPRNAAAAPMLAEELEAIEGWGVALRRTDQYPDAETQVYIPDASEYGLWYRLAPVTFLGGSLEGEGCHRNPMEPAALGSAILYGPKLGAYGAAFGRLGAARAARRVGSGSDLATALGDLLSPDRAARQARAAWIIATEGTEATDTVIRLVRAIMDGPIPDRRV